MERDARATRIATAEPMDYNIEAIARLERDALGHRTVAQRISDVIIRRVGSIQFILLQITLVAAWVVINLDLLPGMAVFDPAPFGLLALLLTIESVFLALFILISQNRMTRQADRRAHLDLQVNILVEQEITTMLRMQQKLCEHLGVDVESIRRDADALVKETDVEGLVDKLEEELPDG